MRFATSSSISMVLARGCDAAEPISRIPAPARGRARPRVDANGITRWRSCGHAPQRLGGFWRHTLGAGCGGPVLLPVSRQLLMRRSTSQGHADRPARAGVRGSAGPFSRRSPRGPRPPRLAQPPGCFVSNSSTLRSSNDSTPCSPATMRYANTSRSSATRASSGPRTVIRLRRDHADLRHAFESFPAPPAGRHPGGHLPAARRLLRTLCKSGRRSNCTPNHLVCGDSGTRSRHACRSGHGCALDHEGFTLRYLSLRIGVGAGIGKAWQHQLYLRGLLARV